MSAEALAAFCGERAASNHSKAQLERDTDRRRYFEREAASWRVEELFYRAMVAAA